MTSTTRSAIVAIAVALGSTACGSDGASPMDDEDNVRTWANLGSAVGVYVHAHGPIAFADGEGPFTDPACPVTSDDGTTVTIEGGCTDSEGRAWEGTATIVRSPEGNRTQIGRAHV